MQGKPYAGNPHVRFDEGAKTALHEDIEWLFEEAEADLAYYRQIKADIAEVGIEEALRHSSRKVK